MVRRIADETQVIRSGMYGMTPLMHAAYKGKADMCRLLLQHGADVNCNQHEYGYTALMFAGLSGKTDITSMMLDAGAETDLMNSVGRTAAQMAAFVGQHDCVTVINNFFSRARLEYYTRPQGLDREPKLPQSLAGPLHKIIMTTNLNPVKIVMLVKENPVLVDVAALEKCYQVMDLLCEQCVKQQDMNEVLAMKMHYISCVFQKCLAFLQKQDDKLDALVKSHNKCSDLFLDKENFTFISRLDCKPGRLRACAIHLQSGRGGVNVISCSDRATCECFWTGEGPTAAPAAR
ncbi:hypothetical protein F2P81_001344 [Scophthalmus maximus]|uniref:Uncharacterized protein n=1 Tax=Scophthalmus maximus TaxID=52904 RepID=A0A6A4TYZ1_SCOMX|nr:hypothetical protein F2P81_001344 [Scophthalmus maximus]